MLIPSATGSGMSQRQTLGGFIHALNHILKVQYYGMEAPDLKYTLTGKPSGMAFEYAKKVLQQQSPNPLRFYMVGDYPEIDIAGGKHAGMETVLVESGMYDPEDI
jgi:ribonucleotide monophosphatase NagD (HAD superfamily)